jgi:polyketide synthase 5
MVAVHQACRSLHDGETDMALAGGVMLMLDSRLYASASGQGMLSPTGRCHSFDVEADGFVRAEGCGVVMLRRLDDAQRDGDRVLAVIRATASNQDGRTENILTPSGDAQVAVFRSALAAAGVDAATVGMVEAHGTGTPVGDTIEYTSVSTVYGTGGRCALTSVKSNFGHAESAAGVLGLMKAVLAVHHGVVPKNLHFNQLPDHLAAIETGLFVPQEAAQWPVDETLAPRRAAVSSYGMSGTNVHAVLEQAPAALHSGESPVDAPAEKLAFPITSSSAEGLRQTSASMADWVEAAGADLVLGDLAYTLARRRGHRPVRKAVIAEDRGALVDGLRALAEGDDFFTVSLSSPVNATLGQATGTGWVPPAAGLPIPSSKISTRRAPFGIATFCICRPSVVKPPTFTWLPLIRPEFTADWG